MFGIFGKKEEAVRLTEKQIKDLMKNMTKSERREFERRQREAEGDRFWDALMMSVLFED